MGGARAANKGNEAQGILARGWINLKISAEIVSATFFFFFKSN